MTEDDFKRHCALIEERGIEGFDAEVNLALMELAAAVVDNRLRFVPSETSLASGKQDQSFDDRRTEAAPRLRAAFAME